MFFDMESFFRVLKLPMIFFETSLYAQTPTAFSKLRPSLMQPAQIKSFGIFFSKIRPQILQALPSASSSFSRHVLQSPDLFELSIMLPQAMQ
jgi:hypothetical protein